MKTVLVTGATGFLGKHLVAQLSRAEPETRLRLLCRSAWPGEPPESVEIVPGDITSPDDVSRAAEGVAAVYHLAGIVQREPKDPGLLYKTHVEGTRNVCEAVKRHGVSKAVFVSTSGTMAVGRTPVERDETAGYAIETVGSWPYYTSKIYAEKIALQYVDDEKLRAQRTACGCNRINGSGNLASGTLELWGDQRRISSPRDFVVFRSRRLCQFSITQRRKLRSGLRRPGLSVHGYQRVLRL